MKTRFKFIHFIKALTEDVWLCQNNRRGDVLGGIDYDARWRQYVFNADEKAVFSSDCLRDIAEFIDALQAEKKAAESANPS